MTTTEAEEIKDVRSTDSRRLQQRVAELEQVVAAYQRNDDQQQLRHHTLEERMQQLTTELAHIQRVLHTERTERQQVEAALRQSEARYRAVVEDQVDLICRFLPNGTLTFVNMAFCRCFGKTSDELLGQSVLPLLHPDDHDCLMQQLARLCVDCPLATSEHRVVTASGDICWQQWHTRALFDTQDTLIEIQAVGRDISDRVQAEEAYRVLVQHSMQGMAIIQDGRIVFANPTMETMTGYTIAELLALSTEGLSMLIHPDDREGTWERLRLRLEDNLPLAPRPHSFRIVRKDGAVRWLETVSARTMYQGRIAVQTTYIDITDYKQNDELLRLQERALMTVTNGILIADANLHDQPIIYCNAAFERITGYACEEVIGSNCRFLQGEDTDRESVARVRRALQDGGDCQVTLKNYRKDRTAFWNELTITPMLDEQGYVTHFIGVLDDITQHVHAEEALHASEEKFRGFFEQSQDALVLVDEQGIIIEWSQGAEQIFGLTRDDVVGKPRWDVLFQLVPLLQRTHDMYASIKQATLDAIQTRGATLGLLGQCYQWCAQRPDDGSLRFLSVHIFPIHTGRGLLLGSIAHDITARKQAEEALHRANGQLEQRVAELEQHNREVTLLSRMDNWLQTCTTLTEAYQVIGTIAAKLFPGQSGALYVSKSNTALKRVTTWGTTPPDMESIEPTTCQMLQNKHPFTIDHEHCNALCGYTHLDDDHVAYCVPLAIQEDTLGMLTLRSTRAAQPQVREHWQRLIEMVAGHCALALMNLQLRERLRYQATRDPLTGLFNRRYLDETLKRELQRAQRHRHPIGIIMLDIDHFKQFNDTYGHDGGDAMLRAVADFLQQKIRGEDIVCRYGGEEFTLLLPGASLEDAHRRAEQLRVGVRELAVHHQQQTLPPITISLGVAVFPQHGSTDDALVKAADLALYRAKDAGRDCVIVAGAG